MEGPMNRTVWKCIRPDERRVERSDCTVVAFALLCGLTYSQSAEMLRNAGRKPNKGFKTRLFLGKKRIVGRRLFEETNTCERVLHSLKYPDGRPVTVDERIYKTLGKFAAAHPEGHYLVTVRGHAVAVMNGVVVDSEDKPNRRICSVWRVT
jgi:hypothetical protein